MRKPNFFILGAPKCGTTSLASWLAGHPQIYMSPIKEPHFFSTDDAYVLTPSRESYEALFKDAAIQHLAVGEASVWYFHSERAVPNILEYSPDSRFIVCLRNPVDMAYSLHGHLVHSGREHVIDFEQAWRLQSQRARGEVVGRLCIEPRHLVYGKVCALGAQLARLYERVGRSRVLPLVLDDMRVSARSEYVRVLEFLGVQDDGRQEFPIENVAKGRRFPTLSRLYMGYLATRRMLHIPHLGIGLSRPLDRITTRTGVRAPMHMELRRELAAYFTPDVELLSRLLQRDLMFWVREGPALLDSSMLAGRTVPAEATEPD